MSDDNKNSPKIILEKIDVLGEVIETIELNGKKYNIVNSFKSTDVEGLYDFIVYETDESKIKNFFAWYPLWIKHKFRWFKNVSVRYIYYIYIKKDFNEWNYNFYWTEPRGEWKMIEILN